MKKFRMSLVMILSALVVLSGCASWNKTQKGAVVGTVAGGTMGAVIGKASGNTALGVEGPDKFIRLVNDMQVHMVEVKLY